MSDKFVSEFTKEWNVIREFLATFKGMDKIMLVPEEYE